MALQPRKISEFIGTGEPDCKATNKLIKVGSQAVQVTEKAQNEKAADWFNPLFREILLSCSGWKASLPTGAWMADAKKVWLKAFIESGLTDEITIRKGIDKLRQNGRQWLPSPYEFRMLCLSASMGDYGMPDIEEAYYEAAEKMPLRRSGDQVEWSHPAVRYAAGRTASLLCEATERQSRPAFTREYKRAFDLVVAGKLGAEAPAISHKAPDKHYAHYSRLLKDHGPKFANEYREDLRLIGVNIQNNGNVTYEAKPAQEQTPLEKILSGLDPAPAKSDNQIVWGEMPKRLITGDNVEANRKKAEQLLKAIEQTTEGQ